MPANMFGMGAFPGMQIPPIPGFPTDNKSHPTATPPGAAFGGFPGQPNMFYGMGTGMVPPGMTSGSFGFYPQTGGPTNYSWSSSDGNGSSQTQFQVMVEFGRELGWFCVWKIRLWCNFSIVFLILQLPIQQARDNYHEDFVVHCCTKRLGRFWHVWQYVVSIKCYILTKKKCKVVT